MNKIMFDILLMLNDKNKWDIKEYSTKLYKPYSIIEREYKDLEREEYVCNGKITKKGKAYLETKRINNAIILAAGISSRFVPLCFEKPKGLLKVKGEVLIERQIRQLKETGIDNIIIVIGHMKEQFLYLKELYGVNFVETDTYKIRNNHASVYAAKAYLNRTIITSADLYFTENIFQKYAYDSYYCTVYKEGDTEERGVILDSMDRIVQTGYGVKDTWVTLGYAFFDERFSKTFIEILDKEYNYSQTIPKFWADIQDEHLEELYMYAKHCDGGVIYEFDSLEELRLFDKEYINKSGSEILLNIANIIESDEGELLDFKPITKEDLGRGFTFICRGKKYICRISDKLKIVDIKRYDEVIQELVNLTESFESFYHMSLPLCAAENVVSDFVNMPLSMGFQERYIVGNTYSYSESDNFIGSTYLLPFYQMISEQCRKIFHAQYTDARTLTGMNCLMMVLTSLTKMGDKLLILGPSAGGHASVRPIAERLGLKVDEIPFDFENQDIDYALLNERLEQEEVKFILLAPSDIIRPFDIKKLNIVNTTVLYDVSQMLGLMGAGLIDNPLDIHDNIVIFGGTHKTFPGPACGLILTNNQELHNKLEKTINPIYIRHTQMHQKVSLLFALVEFEVFGKVYEERIVELSNKLGEELDKVGFNVGKFDGKYSCTHEVFIYTDEATMNRIYNNASLFGITLNKKKKALFNGYGIRLGTQEIARYAWPVSSMRIVAQIIYEISLEEVDYNKVRTLLESLPDKRIQYTFEESTVQRFRRFL